MPVICLKAHFDGQVIQLDEPYDLPQGAQLLVTVLSPATGDAQLAGWAELCAASLSGAFGDHDPEYSTADVRP
jgi:hypothetical protein